MFGHFLAGILDITKLLYDAITALERASSESQARPPLPRANGPKTNPTQTNERTGGAVPMEARRAHVRMPTFGVCERVRWARLSVRMCDESMLWRLRWLP